jgi:hypothetical protein
MSLMQVEDSAPNFICSQQWKAWEDARGFIADTRVTLFSACGNVD